MTSDVKSAISGGSNTSNPSNQQQQHQTLINGNGNATPPATATSATATAITTTVAGNTSVSSATIATDTTRYKSGLSDVVADEDVDDTATSTNVAATSTATATATSTVTATATSSAATPVAAASVFSTGCATMPRTRQYGSNAGGATAANAMTADKKFLSCAPAANTSAVAGQQQQLQQQQHVHHKLQLADKPESKLAALDNLDLAHRLDLIDDDGDDPYGALQDYLERVKVCQITLHI